MSEDLDDRWIDPKTTANYLGVSVDTLAVWRSTGRYDGTLVYGKVGSRNIRYLLSSVKRFMQVLMQAE